MPSYRQQTSNKSPQISTPYADFIHFQSVILKCINEAILSSFERIRSSFSPSVILSPPECKVYSIIKVGRVNSYSKLTRPERRVNIENIESIQYNTSDKFMECEGSMLTESEAQKELLDIVSMEQEAEAQKKRAMKICMGRLLRG